MVDTENVKSNETTVIAQDAHFKGEISFKNNLKIIGSYEGQITTTGHLEVASEANVNADIQVGSISVAGNIQGNLDASDVVELKNTAHIRGDIKCKRLMMDEGASMEGHCQVGKESN